MTDVGCVYDVLTILSKGFPVKQPAGLSSYQQFKHSLDTLRKLPGNDSCLLTKSKASSRRHWKALFQQPLFQPVGTGVGEL